MDLPREPAISPNSCGTVPVNHAELVIAANLKFERLPSVLGNWPVKALRTKFKCSKLVKRPSSGPHRKISELYDVYVPSDMPVSPSDLPDGMVPPISLLLLIMMVARFVSSPSSVGKVAVMLESSPSIMAGPGIEKWNDKRFVSMPTSVGMTLSIFSTIKYWSIDSLPIEVGIDPSMSGRLYSPSSTSCDHDMTASNGRPSTRLPVSTKRCSFVNC